MNKDPSTPGRHPPSPEKPEHLQEVAACLPNVEIEFLVTHDKPMGPSNRSLLLYRSPDLAAQRIS